MRMLSIFTLFEHVFWRFFFWPRHSILNSLLPGSQSPLKIGRLGLDIRFNFLFRIFSLLGVIPQQLIQLLFLRNLLIFEMQVQLHRSLFLPLGSLLMRIHLFLLFLSIRISNFLRKLVQHFWLRNEILYFLLIVDVLSIVLPIIEFYCLGVEPD